MSKYEELNNLEDLHEDAELQNLHLQERYDREIGE